MACFYPTVLITGASSGLGEEFARQLLFSCERMILVARRGDKLKELVDKLWLQNQKVTFLPIVCDLAEEGQRKELFLQLKARAIQVNLLVNNAGLGDYGEFGEGKWEKMKAMMEVNMMALVHLSALFLPQLKESRGAMIQVSSLASVLFIPDFALYAATKSFVTRFSEALAIEVAPFGVRVLALCPGPVATEFGQVARREGFSGDMMPGKSLFYTPKEKVVSAALKGLTQGKTCVYPGRKVAFIAFLLNRLPVTLLRCVMRLRPRRGKSLS